MDTPIKEKPVADLRDYLAEEWTFLAWIRTGIAFMGFGFVVARFGIFGDEPPMTQQTLSGQPQVFSLWFGVALIAIGIAVNLFSARRFMRLAALNRDQFGHRSSRSKARWWPCFWRCSASHDDLPDLVPGAAAGRVACVARRYGDRPIGEKMMEGQRNITSTIASTMLLNSLRRV
jgi:putative membrane protein